MSGMKRTTEKNLMVFTGRAHPGLAAEVVEQLDTTLVPTSAYEFANSEIYVRYEESVRGCDAFVIQSHTAPVNEWIMEHLIMVDALKRASAKRITVVLPFYGYARQDKKHRGREPISARLMADLFKTAGADRLITVDLHADQIQGFFDGPVDHLMALPILADYVKKKYDDHKMAVVSPDAGRIKVAERWSARLGGVPLAFIHKSRRTDRPNETVANRVVGDVKDRMCVLVDDMIDTGGTIVNAADALMNEGAAGVIIAATHAILSDPAVDRLKNSPGHRGDRHQHAAVPARSRSSTSSPASRSPRCSRGRSARSSRTARSPACLTDTPDSSHASGQLPGVTCNACVPGQDLSSRVWCSSWWALSRPLRPRPPAAGAVARRSPSRARPATTGSAERGAAT